MIDPHVHCRDWNQKHKETIEHALYVARAAGLSGIFDMPNTDPAIITWPLIEKRLKEGEEATKANFNGEVFYGLYAGLTSEPRQISEVVRASKHFFPKRGSKAGVVGLKMYAGKSVGNLAIIREKEQKLVYKTLAEEGFDGVLAVHCEKESLMRPNSWHPLFPRSHYYARPPEAEIESVRGQINFASDAKFEGTLYIAHVSVPESVELIDKARQDRMKIRCGVTPHHCLLYEQKIPQAKKGLLYKVNPPLRNKEAAKKMLALLREGKIDWIETDHAPHTLKEKLNEPYMSGFPGLPFYPHFIYYLKKDGFSEELLWKITHHNIEDIFKMGIRPLEWNSSKSPDLNLHTEYEVDVYKDVRQK